MNCIYSFFLLSGVPLGLKKALRRALDLTSLIISSLYVCKQNLTNIHAQNDSLKNPVKYTTSRFYKMGNSNTSNNKNDFSSKSTALDCVRTFGEGEYLKGKVAIVTGGNSGIGLGR